MFLGANVTEIAKMKNQRFKLLLIGFLLLISIWLAWPEPQQTADQSDQATSTQSGKAKKGIDWHLPGFGGKAKQSRPKNRPSSNEDAGTKRIDRLITNQTLSNQEVAEQLRVIAKDKSMPENVRGDALGHGVILDLAAFADMAGDAQLPLEMAEELLQHVINENRDPALQIRAYTDFMNHSSPEIRDQAKDLLAFILEDDEGKADEATLLQMADARLKKIEAANPPEK